MPSVLRVTTAASELAEQAVRMWTAVVSASAAADDLQSERMRRGRRAGSYRGPVGHTEWTDSPCHQGGVTFVFPPNTKVPFKDGTTEVDIDVLTQVSAATRALQSVALGLLDEHLRHCVAGAASASGDAEAERLIDEATSAIERLVKS